MMGWNRTLVSSAVALCATVALMGFAPPLKVATIANHFPAQVEDKGLGPLHGGAAVDRAGNVYVSTDTERGILVFGPDGKFKRSFGPTQIHGLHLTASICMPPARIFMKS
jgi:hypothetical protein